MYQSTFTSVFKNCFPVVQVSAFNIPEGYILALQKEQNCIVKLVLLFTGISSGNEGEDASCLLLLFSHIASICHQQTTSIYLWSAGCPGSRTTLKRARPTDPTFLWSCYSSNKQLIQSGLMALHPFYTGLVRTFLRW